MLTRKNILGVSVFLENFCSGPLLRKILEGWSRVPSKSVRERWIERISFEFSSSLILLFVLSAASDISFRASVRVSVKMIKT